MIGVIERVKNNVLLKCSTLNDTYIADNLNVIIDTNIYHFAESLISMVNDIDLNTSEMGIRSQISKDIKDDIIKKIKRKLFIDSLALQITNDTFIEEYANKEINMDVLKSNYINELVSNENSNQLNMTEDLNLTDIFSKVQIFINVQVIPIIKENIILTQNVTSLVDAMRISLENNLKDMVKELDNKYLEILISELNDQIEEEPKENEKRVEKIMEKNNEVESNIITDTEKNTKFDKYDDMTLFNKMLLSLNTKEEKLTRKENKQSKRKEEIDELLSATNKNIEANIKRENELSQRKVELNSREVELNSKLSEAEVIFLNMKPLIKGLNNIKAAEVQNGGQNE